MNEHPQSARDEHEAKDATVSSNAPDAAASAHVPAEAAAAQTAATVDPGVGAIPAAIPAAMPAALTEQGAPEAEQATDVGGKHPASAAEVSADSAEPKAQAAPVYGADPGKMAAAEPPADKLPSASAGPAMAATAVPPASATPVPPPVEPVPPQTETRSESMAMSESLQKPFNLGLIALAAVLAVQWWSVSNDLRSLREETAKRLQGNDLSGAETKMLAKNAADGAKELHAKFSILESKQAEAQSQQLALEQLYQDLSKNRDEWALAEIEQVLSTASQQLQLAGNVQGALIALQNADRGLSRSDKPQFILIRRAIAKDIEKLKSLPNLDLPGIALRLDSVISQIDTLPLLSDEKPAQIGLPPKKNVLAANTANSKNAGGKEEANKEEPGLLARWGSVIGDTWNSVSAEMWLEVRQLIRVRSVETPDALMMSPSQAYFARENLKLRLLNARLALLSRNEGAFRNDLDAAQIALNKYFDTRAKQTQAAQTLLRQVQASNLSIEMPTLVESLNAVRNYKTKP